MVGLILIQGGALKMGLMLLLAKIPNGLTAIMMAMETISMDLKAIIVHSEEAIQFKTDTVV